MYKFALINFYYILVFNRLFRSSSEDEEEPEPRQVSLASIVAKSHGDNVVDDDDEDGGDDKDEEYEDDDDSPGKKCDNDWVMQLFHSLKDFTWSKITIPNTKMLGLILFG